MSRVAILLRLVTVAECLLNRIEYFGQLKREKLLGIEVGNTISPVEPSDRFHRDPPQLLGIGPALVQPLGNALQGLPILAARVDAEVDQLFRR